MTSHSDNTAGETAEEYQLEETSSDIIPSAEEIEESFSRKRKLAGTEDTQTTVNEEDDFEGEFNDSLLESATQEAKRFKPSESTVAAQQQQQQPKLTDDDEKKRLLNPKNMLDDMWSFPQDDNHATTQSQSQGNESGAMASVSGNSESEATQTEQQSAAEDSALAAEPMSQSTQSAVINKASKDFIPDTAYSDSEDNADSSVSTLHTLTLLTHITDCIGSNRTCGNAAIVNLKIGSICRHAHFAASFEITMPLFCFR